MKKNHATRRTNYGPWLVGLGAALWGTESAWRIPLNELFDAQVIVFWEHVLILLMVDYPNMAALNGVRDKTDPINAKVVGSEDQQRQLAVKRLEIREIMGDKTMRKITLK